jgi:GTP-binding protein
VTENHRVSVATFIKSAVYPADYPDTGGLPEIAVAGRSNVGKSSLINKLVGRRKLAKVSNTPGRTQLLNFFDVDESFVLCDLPGYGYAKVPTHVKRNWGKMVETYLAERSELRGLLLLMDVRRTPGEWEKQLVGWSSIHGYTLVPVVTKVDKLSSSKRKPAIAKVARALGLTPRQVVGWSAVSGQGIDALWARIDRLSQSGVADDHVDPPS